MKSVMKTGLLAAMLLGGISVCAAQVSIGVRIGPPPPARVVRVQPQRPGAEFMWIDGYWYPVGNHYKWHDGYWTRPPYEGARWVGPHHDGRQFFEGYWEGDRGRMEHDHRWDHDHDRDRDRFQDDRNRDNRNNHDGDNRDRDDRDRH